MTRKCQVRFGGRGSEKDSVSCTSPGSYPTLLNEYELYASLEPFNESGRLVLIISLIGER